MATQFRSDLIGREVLLAERDREGVGLLMEGGWKVAIWAKTHVRGGSGNETEVTRLVGARLLSFAEESGTEVLRFDNGCELVVLLGTAPAPGESMVLYGPGSATVVWD